MLNVIELCVSSCWDENGNLVPRDTDEVEFVSHIGTEMEMLKNLMIQLEPLRG